MWTSDVNLNRTALVYLKLRETEKLWESQGWGWTLEFRAVFHFSPGVCGADTSDVHKDPVMHGRRCERISHYICTNWGHECLSQAKKGRNHPDQRSGSGVLESSVVSVHHVRHKIHLQVILSADLRSLIVLPYFALSCRTPWEMSMFQVSADFYQPLPSGPRDSIPVAASRPASSRKELLLFRLRFSGLKAPQLHMCYKYTRTSAMLAPSVCYYNGLYWLFSCYLRLLGWQ